MRQRVCPTKTNINNTKQKVSSKMEQSPLEVAKKKRKAFTMEEKIGIIDNLSNGQTNSVIAKKLNVSTSTIATIWRDRDKIRAYFVDGNTSMSAKKLRGATKSDVDEALLEWFKEQRANNVPLTGPKLQEKANELAKQLGYENFNCSTGFIQRWRKRHSIYWGKISGEVGAVDQNVCYNWIQTVWPGIREGYRDEDIFNTNETGLSFDTTTTEGEISKERLTAIVAANMTGSEKLKLTIIGKSKKPRCFRNVKSLPVQYLHNSHAGMTSPLIEKILRQWDSDFTLRKRKILLLMDDCKAHPNIEDLHSIKLVYLPTVLQPLDQGVVQALKTEYRKFQALESEVGGASKKINVLDAIINISQAWDRVSQETIAKCFAHTGFHSNPEFQDAENLPVSVLQENLLQVWGEQIPQLKEATTTQDWIKMEDVQTKNPLGDSDIPQEVAENVEEFESTDTEQSPEPPTVENAISALNCLRKFIFFNSDDNLPSAVSDSLICLEDYISENSSKKC